MIIDRRLRGSIRVQALGEPAVNLLIKSEWIPRESWVRPPDHIRRYRAAGTARFRVDAVFKRRGRRVSTEIVTARFEARGAVCAA